MSFLNLKKAFSKRTLSHSKESSLSSSGSGLDKLEPTHNREFGYFDNAGQVGGSLNVRGGLPKPAPPFYSMNGRRSANGSSSSRIGEEEEPPRFTRTPQSDASPVFPTKSPITRISSGRPIDNNNPWASPVIEAETPPDTYRYSPPQEVRKPAKTLSTRPSKAAFNPILAGLAGITVDSPVSDNSSYPSPEDDGTSYISPHRRHAPPLAAVAPDPYPTPFTPSSGARHGSEAISPTSNQDNDKPWRRTRQENSSFLQAIAENQPSEPTLPLTPISPDPSDFDASGSEMTLAQRIEEAARIARLKAAGSTLASPDIDQSVLYPPSPVMLPPSPGLAPSENPLPTPPEDDLPPPPTPPKNSKPESTLALQATLDHTIRELHQAKEENQRLQLVQGQQEQDRILIERLQAELLTSKASTRDSHPPPPTRPPPPPPDADNDLQQPTTPISSPSELTPDSDPEISKLREESDILRKQLLSSRSRIAGLIEENTRAEGRHREETVELLKRLKDRQQVEEERLKEIKRLTTERNLADVRVESIVLENKHLTEDRDDILQQLKYQVEENQRFEEEIAVLKKEAHTFMNYKSQMREKEAAFNKLNEEKAGWQAQIDTMQHKLSEAERRVRSLDNISRQRFESKQEGGYGCGSTVGRSVLLHHSPHVKGPSVDVSAAVSTFNQEISHAAWMLSDILERTDTRVLGLATMFPEHQRKSKARAKLIWGEKVTVLLEKHAKETDKNDLLMLTCIEIFITHWCVQIIEGWYPYLPSFSDVLIQLVEQKGSADGTSVQKICGKHTQVIRTTSGEPEYGTWIKEISEDLPPLLRIAGVRLPQEHSDLLSSKLLPIIERAYGLRLALAERDICGGLELAAPSPDMPFHPKFMDSGDAGKRSRKMAKGSSNQGTNWAVHEPIAGTKAIGLKRTLDGHLGQYEMVVRPQVMLVSELEAAS